MERSIWKEIHKCPYCGYPAGLFSVEKGALHGCLKDHLKFIEYQDIADHEIPEDNPMLFVIGCLSFGCRFNANYAEKASLTVDDAIDTWNRLSRFISALHNLNESGRECADLIIRGISTHQEYIKTDRLEGQA